MIPHPQELRIYWIDWTPAQRVAKEREEAERRAAILTDGYIMMAEALERRRKWWKFWKA